jgi:hypothetical protein
MGRSEERFGNLQDAGFGGSAGSPGAAQRPDAEAGEQRLGPH